jgi:hypothetical protein
MNTEISPELLLENGWIKSESESGCKIRLPRKQKKLLKCRFKIAYPKLPFVLDQEIIDWNKLF